MIAALKTSLLAWIGLPPVPAPRSAVPGWIKELQDAGYSVHQDSDGHWRWKRCAVFGPPCTSEDGAWCNAEFHLEKQLREGS